MSNITNYINLHKNPIVRSIGIYTFTNFFAKGVSFLLLFVFTNPAYILPSENGLLSLFSNSMLFLMPFLSMGIIHSTSTDFFKLAKDDFRSFFTTGFVMPIFVMLFSFIVLFISKEFLQRTYGFPYMFVWLIPVITFLTFCNEQLLSLARNNNEPAVFLKANISKTILELGLSFVLVVAFAWRWEGRIAGILVAYTLVGIYAFYYFFKKGYLFGSIKKKHILNELVYAVPIIAMQASIFSMSSSDKFFLSYFTNDNNETVGIYSIGCIFASIIIVLCTALLQYVFPKIYSLLSVKEKIDYGSIKKHFFIYLGIMTAGSLCIILLTPLLYHYFINEKYSPALKYVYLLCTGYFLWSVSYFFYSFLLYHKQKKKLLALSLCCIIVSISCNYFFIKERQDGGAAIATVTCYFIVLILTLIFTREYWKKIFFADNK